MSIKRAVAVTAAATTIATTGIGLVAPKTPDVGTYNNQDGHSQQVHNQQLRDGGEEDGWTEYSRRYFTPGENLPPEDLPRLPFRLP